MISQIIDGVEYRLTPEPGQTIQYDTMPTYTDFDLGTIIQYVGATTQNYTKGYFYKRGNAGWEQVSVQPEDPSVGSLNDLTDVNISNLSNGQILKYNSTSQKWENQSLGTAAAKDFTNLVAEDSGDLVTSGAVFNELNNLPNPMVYKGTLGDNATISSLPSASSSNEGYTYKVITAGTYASQVAKIGDVFVSTGEEWTLIPAGDEDSDTWRQINVNGTQVVGSAISTGAINFKSGTHVTASVSGNDITFSTDAQVNTIEGVQVNGDDLVPDGSKKVNVVISGKADKVTTGTPNGKLAELDASGNLTDSGVVAADVVTKVTGGTTGNFAGLDANGKIVDSGSKASDFLTSHQDISGKADKVANATNGNFAGLDVNGNLTDSGKKASDFLTSHQDISGKADKVTTGTPNGKLASLDETGNLANSGVMADMTSATITGNPLLFTTDSEQVASNTVITFEPIQAGSGDPSPSNPRAISGYDNVRIIASKKNLFNPEWLNKSGMTHNSDGSYSGSPTTISTNFSSGIGGVIVAPNTQYVFTFKAKATGGSASELGMYYSVTYTDGTFDEYNFANSPTDYTQATIVTNASKSVARFNLLFATSNTNTWYINDVQLEKGSTATTYEPYNPITDISEQLPTTIYGGALVVESGKLVVTHKAVDMGDLDWVYNGNNMFLAGFPSDSKGPSNNWNFATCEVYRVATNDFGDKSIVINNGNYITGRRALVLDTSYSDASIFKTAVTGKKIVYKIDPDVTIQLPPAQVKLLLGSNTVTTNGTSISLTYRKGEVAKLSDLEGIADGMEAVADFIKCLSYEGAGLHNSICRGKYLGDHITAEQLAEIKSGRFRDLFVGDYWVINGHEYYIAHLDYWLHTGDIECVKHHAVIVPATSLVTGKMNNGNVVTGAYAGSDFKTGANSNTALADIKAIIQADFGSANILTHRELFANAVDGNSASSGWGWADSDIDLMNETMVYGHCVCSKPGTYGHIYEVGIDKSQLELFAKRPDLITTRGYWWLRDVVTSTYFACVYHVGYAGLDYASNSFGIRPAFAIC